MHLDITEEMDKTIETLNDILRITNTRGTLITMDSNQRKKQNLQEFLISKQLFIMNEDSEMNTFQGSRRSSNIDLTICNKKLLSEVQEWKNSEEESCSDHRIIQFSLGQYNTQLKETTFNLKNI